MIDRLTLCQKYWKYDFPKVNRERSEKFGNRERDEKRTENKIKTKKSFPPAKARMQAKSFCWLLLNSITFLPNFGV